MPGTHIKGRLGGRAAEVLNLSLSGALLLHKEALPVDCQFTLSLERNSVEVSVEARVIRSSPAPRSRWLLAVTFLKPSAAAKKAIPQLIMHTQKG
jgi:hypothetical protein